MKTLLFLLTFTMLIYANHDFALYKQKTQKKFIEYKQSQDSLWKDFLKSTETAWVEYSDDNMSRSVVDFKNQEIVIDVVSKKNDKDNVLLKISKKLTQILDKENNGQKVVSDVLTKKEYTTLTTIKSDSIKEKDNGLGFMNYSLKLKLPSNYIQRKAFRYKSIVSKYCNKYGLDKSLVFSIMHSESSFNPMSESSVAYGIMQIVPKSAGMDVTKYLYGKEELVSKEFLLNPENSILFGTTYLHLLKSKHFYDVDSGNAKKLCMISAYNTGPGNLLRTFDYNKVNAISKINSFSDIALKKYLLNNLPYEETKTYLARVTSRIPQYDELIRLKKL